MGFPSRRARSRASNRAPGEILVQEWKGSEIEKALVSIHPERFGAVEQVALSTLFVIGNEVYGSRRNLGSLTLGVSLNKDTGDLEYTKDDKGIHARNVLTGIIRQLGPIPQGFAEMPEPKAVQRTKAQKYACPICKTNIRCATPLQAFCLHMGKPEFGQDAAQFALQVPKEKAQPKAAVPPKTAAPVTAAENIRNVMEAVKHGAARVVHGGGRQFGAAEATT